MWLGIDFGTCFSSAALMLNGTLKLVKDSRKLGFSFPTSVYITPQDEVFVGHSADYQRNREPSRFRSEFKRDLGRDIPYQLGERQLLPEDLVAEVLRKLKSEADQMVKALDQAPFTNAVITVPATYQEHKRILMQKAGFAAGFTQVELLEEPVATAIDCAQRYNIVDGEIILVYDLGGGTFDATLMQKQGTDYKFLTMPVGDAHCGGIDFDREIYKNFNHRCSPALQVLLGSHQRGKEVLLASAVVADACRDLKHQLSEVYEAETSVVVPGTGSMEYYGLNRESFNDMIEPYVQKSLLLCRQLVKDAGLRWEQLDQLLMVGGSCRIPYVKQLLERELQRPVYLVDEPELAVCQGAAIYGARLGIEKDAIIFNNRGNAHLNVGNY